MIRIAVMTVAIFCSVPVVGAEQLRARSVLLGVGTENLLLEVEDDSAFLAYRQRMEDRRLVAQGIRSEMTAMRPPARFGLAVAVAPNQFGLHPNMATIGAQHRAIRERQRQIARAQAKRMQQWGRDLDGLVRKFDP